MVSTGRLWLLVLALLAATPTAFGQALPDAVRSAGVTVAEWKFVQDEVKRAAAARGASERALATIAQRISANSVRDGTVDIDEVVQLIDGKAQALVDLQAKLVALESADDPSIARLLAQANAAINAGDLSAGDQLLAEAAESDLAAIATETAKLANRQIRAGDTFGGRGDLASLTGDYLAAARLYAQAAETVPADALAERWVWRMFEAGALDDRGRRFNDPRMLFEAARLYREVALPLAPRDRRPEDWAATQNDLGNVLYSLAMQGDDGALSAALAAYRAALEVSTRERDPTGWALIQNNLGNSLLLLGDRGDDAALASSIVAFRAAQEVFTRDAEPAYWGTTQNNMAGALATLGERGDDQALRNAVSAYTEALEVRTRKDAPDEWATTQNNLGTVLWTLGDRGDHQALSDAIEAFESALEVFTREYAPADWAMTQNNLGNVLLTKGEKGDKKALHAAEDAYRAALQVRTRENAPIDWAMTQYNLGNVLSALGEQGETSLFVDAVAAYRAALEGTTLEREPIAWADRQYNLALALEALSQEEPGRIDDALTAARASHEAYRRGGATWEADESLGMINRLDAQREKTGGSN